MQNSATRLVTASRTHDHVTPILTRRAHVFGFCLRFSVSIEIYWVFLKREIAIGIFFCIQVFLKREKAKKRYFEIAKYFDRLLYLLF